MIVCIIFFSFIGFLVYILIRAGKEDKKDALIAQKFEQEAKKIENIVFKTTLVPTDFRKILESIEKLTPVYTEQKLYVMRLKAYLMGRFVQATLE